MKKIFASTFLILAAGCFSGCAAHLANATGSLDDITAQALQINPSEVADTSNMRAGAFTTTWDAELIDGRRFTCSATDMLDNPSCRPIA